MSLISTAGVLVWNWYRTGARLVVNWCGSKSTAVDKQVAGWLDADSMGMGSTELGIWHRLYRSREMFQLLMPNRYQDYETEFERCYYTLYLLTEKRLPVFDRKACLHREPACRQAWKISYEGLLRKDAGCILAVYGVKALHILVYFKQERCLHIFPLFFPSR